ncbi:DUF4097 family beta strand repeat-containing protein [Ascidiimonas aurantiaca]|uniref:DUF4097 family beta strand repeat-containing protein n=1 Tax=Ascidiimonas aurantiaca TaxID=1685432 RepID=UPI0030EBBB39
MKNLTINKFKAAIVLLLAVSFTYAQKQSKTYKETFNVNKDVTIDLNTSYTNIEFETWDKDVVEVTGYIEIEDATKEKAEAYFDGWGFKAIGNSSEVSVSSNISPNIFYYGRRNEHIISDDDFNFVVPEMVDFPEIAPFVVEMPDMPPLPPMPPLAFESIESINFDYEAYKKDGDKYLEKWKKKFKKEFDGNFKKQMEEWKAELEERKERMAEQREEMKVQVLRMKEEVKKTQAEREKKVQELREQTQSIRKELIEKAARDKKDNFFIYRNAEGRNSNLNVKKTIKIKMPKGARLKINVRHGEVKLAENMKNIKATLSHTRLLAGTIDGYNTFIKASYSPLKVQNWNYGNLNVNYSKEVELENVKNMKLTSNSSDIRIGLIAKQGDIESAFSKLTIDKISDSFEYLDIHLDNTDLVFSLPKTPFSIDCKSINSKMRYPENLNLKVLEEGGQKYVTGFFKDKNSGNTITIYADLSNVTMQ